METVRRGMGSLDKTAEMAEGEGRGASSGTSLTRLFLGETGPRTYCTVSLPSTAIFIVYTVPGTGDMEVSIGDVAPALVELTVE